MDIPRTREEAREGLQAVTEQINEGLEKGRYTLHQLEDALVRCSRDAAASTNTLVHDYPWSAIGVGVAIGLLVGAMIPRR
jgi:ElaB/YqjD/DUF883 family membrane-anchored ribosome-binding protein